jgi:Arc/MetJ-type ribon-helix-helix transcriptional regulator
MPKLGKPRKKRGIRIRLDLQQWVMEQVKKKKFQNFSHAVDVALEKLRDSEKEEKKSLRS